MMRSLALLVFVTIAAASRAQIGPVEHVQVGALDRTYMVERFRTDQANGRVPIIVYLHSLGTLVSEAVPARSGIQFTALAGMEPVLVVHPQGVSRRWDPIPARIETWQRLSGTNGEPVDEIAFLRALIRHVIAAENGDPARVYVVGVSAGGYLVPRVACEMGDEVAGVADVIATSRRAVFTACPSGPVPFALFASTTDDINPYAGQAGDEIARLASAPETAAFFAKHNGCSRRTETALPHLDPTLDSTVSLVRFSDCRDGAEVRFYRVDGSGHSVPSLAPIGPEGWNRSGRRNRDMETAGEIWNFFSSHHH